MRIARYTKNITTASRRAMLKVERSGGSFKNLYMQRSNPVREPCNGARSIRRKCSLAIKSRLNAQTKKKGDTMRSPPSHLLPTSNAYSDAPAHCTLQFLAQKAMCKPHTSSVNRLPLPPSSELGVPLRSNVAAVPASAILTGSSATKRRVPSAATT